MNEIAYPTGLWDIYGMKGATEKKEAAERRAVALAARLAQIRPDDIPNERQWCQRAGVSASFFSNLRGTRTKPPSEPTIGNLRAILTAANMTIPEFFIEEARGRLATMPSERALERALAKAWPEKLPDKEKSVRYLASTVHSILALPERRQTIVANSDPPEEPAPEAAGPLRGTTRKA